MSVPLARRLAGPSFSLNVRYDQAWMTKRKEHASQPLQIGETKVDFVADREVFDVKEAEILVSKRSPGRISDGFARVFSSVNGWQGMPATYTPPPGAPGAGVPRTPTDDDKKLLIRDKVKFIGIAVTEHRAEKIAKFDQGFVACISGIVTVMNESADTMHPGTPLTFDVCSKYPIQHGIHARKVRFHFRKAGDGDPVVAKALSYSKKGSTVDILLHPQKY